MIDAVVEISAAGALRFLHARIAAAIVRHARRPNFLAADGRKQVLRRRRFSRFHSGMTLPQVIQQIFARHQIVPVEACKS